MKLNFILEIAVSMELMPNKAFARNPVCMLCSESKENRHVVKIFSKAGGNLEGCPSFRYLLPPSLIHQFMLTYYNQQFRGVLGSCDRPMPGLFPALPIFLGKTAWERGCAGLKNRGKEKQTNKQTKRPRTSESRLTLTPVFARPFYITNVISLVPTN